MNDGPAGMATIRRNAEAGALRSLDEAAPSLFFVASLMLSWILLEFAGDFDPARYVLVHVLGNGRS